MIYTPLAVEEVLGGQDERRFTEIKLGEAVLLVEQGSDGSGRLMRILSTDPRHYMIPGLQPGDIIPRELLQRR